MNIGDLLRTAGVISPEQLQAALDHQKANGGSLGHALVALGFVGDEEVAKLLSRLYDVPRIDLEGVVPDPAAIRMLPAEMARKLQVVPVSVAGRVLTIATADPTDVVAVDSIAFRTGCNVKQVVAPESALKAAIDRHYGSTRPVPSDSSGQPQPAVAPAEPAAPVFLHPPTRAVWWLVAVNVAIFGLELLWGGSSSPLTLHRMGAGLGRAAVAHQPWRVLSAAFLHVNVVHLVLNMWALVVFGRILEVMLGARRFIVLYGLSALGGGLASSLVHAAILSAGASGAVWGLMTAQIALIVRLKKERGPEAVPVPTSALVKPLVINFLFSLLPFVDLSAHLGGGAVGAGLIFSGVMWGPRPSAAWRPAAWTASLAMAGCMVVALAHGRPWELRWPPPLVPRAIAGTPITLAVPRGLEAQYGRGSSRRVLLGAKAGRGRFGAAEAPVSGAGRPRLGHPAAREGRILGGIAPGGQIGRSPGGFAGVPLHESESEPHVGDGRRALVGAARGGGGCRRPPELGQARLRHRGRSRDPVPGLLGRRFAPDLSLTSHRTALTSFCGVFTSGTWQMRY